MSNRPDRRGEREEANKAKKENRDATHKRRRNAANENKEALVGTK
jgi:hypothetical protein